MRKFQLTITLDCFDNPSKKSIKVYTDANNVWEAVCAGFRRLTDCLNKVEVNGSCGSVDCAGSCTVSGDVNGSIDATGSVTCGTVYGDIDAAGSVRCRR